MKLLDLPRQTEAIRYAAARLGYNKREVNQRMDAIDAQLTQGCTQAEVRQFIINMRGWDMPPQFGTTMWLDAQLERLIDGLASDAETAELDALAAR